MADSLENLGTTPMFTAPFDWKQDPKSGFVISRNLAGFPGTAAQLKSVVDEVPIKFEIQTSVSTVAESYYLMNFLYSQLGRNYKFWVPYQRQLFKLADDFTSGATAITVEDNNFDLIFQGYERIYIKMNNGDLLTRWVDGVTEVAGGLSLSLVTGLDRDVTQTNQYEIGRLLLVRFDTDSFNFDMLTDRQYELILSFVELVKEYGEV